VSDHTAPKHLTKPTESAPYGAVKVPVLASSSAMSP